MQSRPQRRLYGQTTREGENVLVSWLARMPFPASPIALESFAEVGVMSRLQCVLCHVPFGQYLHNCRTAGTKWHL
jgi:hypothetical protein